MDKNKNKQNCKIQAVAWTKLLLSLYRQNHFNKRVVWWKQIWHRTHSSTQHFFRWFSLKSHYLRSSLQPKHQTKCHSFTTSKLWRNQTSIGNVGKESKITKRASVSLERTIEKSSNKGQKRLLHKAKTLVEYGTLILGEKTKYIYNYRSYR